MCIRDRVRFDEPSTGDAEIYLWISIAQAKFYEIIKKLTNFKIHLNTREYWYSIHSFKSTHLLLSNWDSYSNPDAKDKFCLYHNAAKSSLEVVVKEKSFATQNPTLRYFKLAKLPTFQVLFWNKNKLSGTFSTSIKQMPNKETFSQRRQRIKTRSSIWNSRR